MQLSCDDVVLSQIYRRNKDAFLEYLRQGGDPTGGLMSNPVTSSTLRLPVSFEASWHWHQIRGG